MALDAALTGDGLAPPEGWEESVICQEFGCTPADVGRQPYGLTRRIVMLRRYATARRLVDAAEKQTDVPPWARDLVGAVLERRAAEAEAEQVERG